MEETKRCTKCGELKPLHEFYKRGDSDKHRPACKLCTNTETLDKYHKQGGKEKQKKRSFKNLTKRYGISPEIYEEERVKQNYSCLLCGLHESKSTHGRLHMDHCHETGKYRGLLCVHCNVALGAFKDNVDVMRKAIEYLNENRSRHRKHTGQEDNLAGGDEGY